MKDTLTKRQNSNIGKVALHESTSRSIQASKKSLRGKFKIASTRLKKEYSTHPHAVHPLLKDYFTYTYYKSAMQLKLGMDQALRQEPKFGLVSIHLGILRILIKSGSKNQKQLCEETGTDKATMVKLINQLLKKKYVTCEVEAKDKRVHRISATDAGKIALEIGSEVRSKQEARFLQSLSREEENQLRKIVSKLTKTNEPL